MMRTTMGCWGKGAALIAMVLGLEFLAGAFSLSIAQDSLADSTAAATGQNAPADSAAAAMGAMAPMDSTAADSTAIAAFLAQLEQLQGFRWLDFAGPKPADHPSVKGSFLSSKASYGPAADFDLPLLVLEGFKTVTHYHNDRSKEPATNQEKSNRKFSSKWDRSMSDWGRFNMNLSSSDSRTDRVGFEPSKSTNTTLNSVLSGRGVLGQSRVSGKWSIQGGVNKSNVKSGSRSGATNQTLNRGVFSGGLGRQFGELGVSMSAGLNAAAGPQKLSAAIDGSGAQEDTKTTVSDTLGVNLSWHGTDKQTFTANMSRMVSNEDRLGYVTDFRGVAIFDPATSQKIVGNETESRNITKIQLKAGTKIYRSIRTSLSYGFDRKETQYKLSQQGFIPEQGQSFKGDLWFRYARAGSLKVSLGLNDRWDDRRPADTGELRGQHHTVSDAISFTLDQSLTTTTSLHLVYAEDLAQQVYDYKLTTGTLDADVLTDRYEAKLNSKAIDKVNVTLASTFKKTSNISIDAAQVANNNRDLDTWKVTGDYRWTMTPAVTFGQSYQLSIDYTDYYYSWVEEVTRRDKFYKRTQMKTDLNVTLPGAVGFTATHVVDRTRGGTKQLVGGVESPSYTDDLTRRQDEQRLNLSLKIPLFGYMASVATNQIFRTLQGMNDETQGDLRVGLKGKSSFLNQRLVLGLDLGYVWAFGPPRVIRIDRDRRYFTSNTYLSWAF